MPLVGVFFFKEFVEFQLLINKRTSLFRLFSILVRPRIQVGGDYGAHYSYLMTNAQIVRHLVLNIKYA